MRWQTIASSVSMRIIPGIISPTATPLPTAYDCVAVYIADRRTNLVVYGGCSSDSGVEISTPLSLVVGRRPKRFREMAL